MAAGVTVDVRVQAADIDTAGEIERLASGRMDVGAVVTFSGLCRDEGGRLEALELEHYPGMAEAEIGRIAEEACGRWPLSALVAIHRHGRIRPGETIVFVAAASAHRQAAFDAASFVMDYLKTSAPFWKKEHLRDGRAGDWVEAHERDERAEARWRATGDHQKA